MPSTDSDTFDLARLTGTLVGDKYRIDRMIGRGGMGAVFAATNTAIGKRVALKFLGREAARDPAATVRFQREAQAAGVIESEHIVHVFDAGTSPEGLPFLVMELLTGEDLRARLDREGPLRVAEATKIASEVLRALVRAHAAGIVHRDLKPDNVFLCRRDDGSDLVKIVDFGISKLQHQGGSERITYRGTVLGTAHYVSPEQAHGRDDVDHRADLYGVGVLLFEMLAGRPPHLGPSYEAVLVAICTEDAPDVRTLRPDTPPVLATAVACALSRDPKGRYASAEEFLGVLAGAASGAQRRSPRRARTLVAAVLATLLGFTLTAVLVARRTTSTDAPRAPSTAATPAATEPLPPAATAAVGADTPHVVPMGAALPTASMTVMPATPRASSAGAKKKSTTGRADGGVARSLELSTREP
jgi:eukaryotic-like serine/threonine-protein kinase